MAKLWNNLTKKRRGKEEKMFELESSFIELEKIIELIRINPRLSGNDIDRELNILKFNINSIKEIIKKHTRGEC